MTATASDRLRAMLADLKMPGALEAVDGVLAPVDSGAVTASEAIELVLTCIAGTSTTGCPGRLWWACRGPARPGRRCFRHQLLLPRPYLVLTKPLRLDIQCQRAASVKIGWKYLDD